MRLTIPEKIWDASRRLDKLQYFDLTRRPISGWSYARLNSCRIYRNVIDGLFKVAKATEMLHIILLFKILLQFDEKYFHINAYMRYFHGAGLSEYYHSFHYFIAAVIPTAFQILLVFITTSSQIPSKIEGSLHLDIAHLIGRLNMESRAPKTLYYVRDANATASRRKNIVCFISLFIMSLDHAAVYRRPPSNGMALKELSDAPPRWIAMLAFLPMPGRIFERWFRDGARGLSMALL